MKGPKGIFDFLPALPVTIESDAEDTTQQEAEEATEEHDTPPEPAEHQTEDASQLDVPDPHGTGLEEGEQEVEADQDERATKSA